MWGDDAPPDERRSADLPLSANLPETLIELLDPEPFDLVYKAQCEVKAPKAEPGKRSVPLYKLRNHKLRFPTPGQHGFREPARAELLTEFRRKADPEARSLNLLWAFYREHDGALLFQPAKGNVMDAHIQLFGLADQEYAVGCVRYYMEEEVDSRERADKFFVTMGCSPDSVLCLALIDASFYLVPLTGKHAGRVFRFSARAFRLSEFAPTTEVAIELFVSKIAQLSGEFGPAHAIGDESFGQATVMKLAAVKPRAKH
jgi:hypothetical protein